VTATSSPSPPLSSARRKGVPSDLPLSSPTTSALDSGNGSALRIKLAICCLMRAENDLSPDSAADATAGLLTMSAMMPWGTAAADRITTLLPSVLLQLDMTL
tara:strand:+ start:233 stop:538 length:306 start_codon:yes stop_codon:yes gene_type:complete